MFATRKTVLEVINEEYSYLRKIGEGIAQSVLFQTRQAQNTLGSGIGAGDLRSRSLHVDLHAELHHVENGRPADSAPFFAGLARFSFNWRDPLSKNVKSSCSSRHQTRLRKSWPARRNSNIKTYHTTPYHEEYFISSSFSSVDVTRPVPIR